VACRAACWHGAVSGGARVRVHVPARAGELPLVPAARAAVWGHALRWYGGGRVGRGLRVCRAAAAQVGAARVCAHAAGSCCMGAGGLCDGVCTAVQGRLG